MSKATSIDQLQQQQVPSQHDPNVMGAVEDVLQELNQQEQQQQYYEQQQQQQQQQHQQQQHQQQQQQYQQPPHQMVMPHPPQHPMMIPPPMPNGLNTKPLSIIEKVMIELKDALIVLIVFVLLNFEPINNALNNLLLKLTENAMVLLVVKGLIAALAFYGIKKVVMNN